MTTRRRHEPYAVVKRRRQRARRSVFALAAVCSLAALGVGGFELHAEGLSEFLDRPAGVGATPTLAASPAAASSTPAQPAVVAKAASAHR